MLEQRGAISLKVLTEANRASFGQACEHLRQLSFASAKRLVTQIFSIAIKQVEGVVPELVELPGLEGSLQGGEARGTMRLLDHKLAVDNSRARGNAAERIRQCAEPAGPVEALTGQQLDVLSTLACFKAITVEFDFVDPLAATGRLVRKLSEAWLHEGRQIAAIICILGSDLFDRLATEN